MVGAAACALRIGWFRTIGWVIGGAMLAIVWQHAPAAAQSAGTLERIQKQAELRLAYREDARPFSYNGDDGKPAGYSVNLCLEVAAGIQRELNLQQLTVAFVPVTAENRFEAITGGAADMLCEATTATLSRRKLVDFSIPTFVSGASLVIQPGGPTSVETLAGKKVGVLDGTTTKTALELTLREGNINAEIVVVKTHDEGFEMLEKNAIDAYFGDRTILADRLRRNSADSRLLLAENYLTIEPYALAMPIDHDFRLAVDRALSQLFRTGGMIKVFRKSFDAEDKPSDLLKMLSRVSGLPD